MSTADIDPQFIADLAEDLRRVREERGLSQEEVAFTAGVSVRTYGCLERGESSSGAIANPGISTLVRVLAALGVERASLEIEPNTASSLLINEEPLGARLSPQT